MKVPILAAASGLAFSASLIVSPAFAQGRGDRVDANGMPTTHSTPQEQAETAAINKDVAANNAAADAQADANNAAYQAQQQQYRQQQQQYQNELDRSQTQQQQYRDRTATYDDLRARYALWEVGDCGSRSPPGRRESRIVERQPGGHGDRYRAYAGWQCRSAAGAPG